MVGALVVALVVAIGDVVAAVVVVVLVADVAAAVTIDVDAAAITASAAAGAFERQHQALEPIYQSLALISV